MSRENGSAYIVALLALVVLTILGLGLSLITQTEMLVGANERTIQRVFYASDSGFATSTARALTRADYLAHDFTIPEIDAPAAALGTVNEVAVTALVPILYAPCNLCDVNDPFGDVKKYYDITHLSNASAARESPASSTAGKLAEKTISAMIGIQPIEGSTEAMLPLDDPDSMQQMKY